MKSVLKITLYGMVAVIVLWLHNIEKKKKNISWPEYGKSLLGIDRAKRSAYLDELRCLAVGLVIIVHGLQSGASHISVAGEPELARMLTSISGLILSCNLLFVMISGALLLPYREEKVGDFYCKRVAKVVIPLVAYYGFYLRRSGLLGLSLTNFVDAFRTIIAGPNELVPHFWLIYVMIGLYISVPFLRYMLKDMTDKVLTGMMATFGILLVLKLVHYFGNVGMGINSFLLGWEGVFLMGYFLSRPVCRRYDRGIQIAGLLAGALIFAAYITRDDASIIGTNVSLLMVLWSSFIFVNFQKREGKCKPKVWLQMVGKYSYSILLIHWYILFVIVEETMQVGPLMFDGYGMLGGILLQSVMAFVLSVAFAVVFDQTVVFVMGKVWDMVCQGVRRVSKNDSII